MILWFEFCGSVGQYFLGGSLSVYSNIISSIYERFLFSNVVRDVFSMSIPRDIMIKGEENFYISSANRAKVVLEMIEVRVFPMVKFLQDIEGFNNFVNVEAGLKTPNLSGFYIPHRLIAARLAGSDDFERLATILPENFGGANEAAIKGEEWPKLVAYHP